MGKGNKRSGMHEYRRNRNIGRTIYYKRSKIYGLLVNIFGSPYRFFSSDIAAIAYGSSILLTISGLLVTAAIIVGLD